MTATETTRLRPIPTVLALPSSAGTEAPAVLITPAPDANALPFDGDRGPSEERIVRIARLDLSTSCPRGATLSVGAGAIAGPGGTRIPFRVATVPAGAEMPSPFAFTDRPGATATFVMSAPGSVALDLYVRYAPGGGREPGSYGATVHVTLCDND